MPKFNHKSKAGRKAHSSRQPALGLMASLLAGLTAALLAVALGGCSIPGREIVDLKIVKAVGVDWQEGRFTVTAVAAEYREDQAVYTQFTGQGTGVQQALDGLLLQDELFFDQSDWLLLSEQAAQRVGGEIVSFCRGDMARYSSLMALALCEGQAADLLEAAAELADGQGFPTSAALGGWELPLYQVRVAGERISDPVPVLALNDSGGLQAVSAVCFSDDSTVYFTGSDFSLLSLLLGHEDQALLTFEREGRELSAVVSGCRTRYSCTSAIIRAEMTGRLQPYTGTPAEIRAIFEQESQYVLKKLAHAGCDCFGYYSTLAKHNAAAARQAEAMRTLTGCTVSLTFSEKSNFFAVGD